MMVLPQSLFLVQKVTLVLFTPVSWILKSESTQLDNMPDIPFKIMQNVGNPDQGVYICATAS